MTLGGGVKEATQTQPNTPPPVVNIKECIVYEMCVTVEMGTILTIHMTTVYLRIGVTEVVGLAGVTEVVGLAGVTEVVGLAGVTEVVGLAGVTEVVGLAGVTEVVGLAGVTEVVGLAGVTEVVGLAGVTEVVGLAGSPPAEDGCVQMLSSVTEDKLSEVSCNGVNVSCRFLASVNVNLLVPNTLISPRYKRPVDVMLILRYFPLASAVRFITTNLIPSSLTIENTVLSVLVERRSALWTERFRAGMPLGCLNVIFTLPTHHPWGMSSTTKGLVLPCHPYTPRLTLLLSRVGWAPSLIAHVRSPPLSVHCPRSRKPAMLGCVHVYLVMGTCAPVWGNGHSQLVHSLLPAPPPPFLPLHSDLHCC